MGGRYVYEFKILIFLQCFHMLFMEWQEKWKGGGGDESVTRLQLFKITLKFCKRWLFTVHLLPAVCSLGLEVWMGFLEVLPSALPSVPSLTGKYIWTRIHCSIKWSHFPLFLIFVALVSSRVMEGQSYVASLVITGSWHGVSTAAKSCRGSRITASFVPRMREKSLFISLNFRAA